MKKQCKACKSDIDAKATKCPKCGADQRNWFRRHPVLTVILALILIGMIGGAAGGDKSSSPQSENKQQAKETTQPPQEAVVIAAQTLVGEYDKNKLLAQDKYTGKIVQTTGYIVNISNDITGSYYLSLKPNNDQYYFGTTIACYFDNKDDLTSLEKDQKVTVKGKMQDMTLGIVNMKDCELVK